MSRRHLVAAALAAMVGVSGAAHAVPRPGSVMTYRIDHEAQGELGFHRLTFSRQGDDLVVDVDSEISVQFLAFTAFRYAAKRREVWRDGRMIAYQSATDDDGEEIRVRARTAGDRLIIEGPEGRTAAAVDTFPTHPWNRAIVDARVLMHTTTGHLLHVTVAEVGKEQIVLDGRAIEATKYRMTGDHEREIWFDTNGNWVRLRFYEYGNAVTYTLKTSAAAPGDPG